MQIRQVLSDDCHSLRLEILDGGKPISTHDLNAADVDELIIELGRNRELLQDTVPVDLEFGSRIATIPAPQWRVHATTRSLFVRHPGYGWLGFSFPTDEAARLGDRLGANTSLKP